MKVFLKAPVYFQIDVADGTDRKLVCQAFDNLIYPEFWDKAIHPYLNKEIPISLKTGYKKIVGETPKISILDESEFFKKIKKSLKGPSQKRK